jgi:hypothetical protein
MTAREHIPVYYDVGIGRCWVDETAEARSAS